MVNNLFYLFMSGLLFGSGPCLATCGPILITYIAGTKKHTLKALFVYGLFSLARISVYLFLSLAIYFFGRFTLERLIGNSSRFILIIGGAFIVLMGILTAMGRSYTIIRHDKKNVFALGLIVGFLPCAPLLAILSYIGLVSKSWVDSLYFSLSFGLGTTLSPLILLTALSGLIARLLKDRKTLYQKIFSFICGLIIIFLGIQLIVKAF